MGLILFVGAYYFSDFPRWSHSLLPDLRKMTPKPKLCPCLRQAGIPLQSGLHFLNSDEGDRNIIPAETAKKLPPLAEWAGDRGNGIRISDFQRKACHVFLYRLLSPAPKATAGWARGLGCDSVYVKIALKTRSVQGLKSPLIPKNRNGLRVFFPS